jgi:hypothetical protein
MPEAAPCGPSYRRFRELQQHRDLGTASCASSEFLGEAEHCLRRCAITNDPRFKVERRDLFETPPHSSKNPLVVISERASAKERQ